MEETSQLNDGMTPTRENPNVFDDEFEVEDFDGVADGYRPGHNHDREGSWRQDREDVPIQPVSAHYATTSITPAGPSRNSTRKSRSHVNPFASPEDDPETLLERTPSGNLSARRSVSSASSHHYAGTESPRFGSGGPSHPYSMYPQGTMVRTPSTATASTARPQRHSSSRYRPQHPYGLYTQGVGDDLDDEHGTTQNPVPVGFLGLGHSFQRRRGPDGEEQDIVGDFGHAEQLPPYTRYPEDGPEKAALLGVPNPPSALLTRAPVLGTDPTMPLMHTPVQQTQQSMMDESNLNRQPSTMSRSSTLQASEGNSPSNSLKEQKSWGEKSWKEKRKTRFCGIPFWYFLLAAGVLAFIVAIIGGVIGGFVEGQKKGQESALAAAGSTSLPYDASLIVTATTKVPSATGTYALPLGTPQETQAACLTIPSERVAWDCNLAGYAELSITVDTPVGSDGEPGARLYSEVLNETLLAYGTQRSGMHTRWSPFLVVEDRDDPEDGPAYFFQTQYDKIVVLPEDAFDQHAGVLKRDVYGVPQVWQSRRRYAQPAEKPWFCYWNKTFVEGFIYPNKKAAPYSSSSSSYPPSPTSGASPSTPTGNTPTSSGSIPPTTIPWSITGVPQSQTVTTTLTMSGSTCSYTGVASAFPSWMQHNYPTWYNHWDEYQQEHADDDNHPPDRAKRHERPDYGFEGDGGLSQYPYLVKIEERRIPDSPKPYCVKNQVLDNHNWNVVAGADGEPIKITLRELDPDFGDYGTGDDGDDDGSQKLRRKRAVSGECHCQWQSGQ